jgi:hypothetical protein
MEPSLHWTQLIFGFAHGSNAFGKLRQDQEFLAVFLEATFQFAYASVFHAFGERTQ